MYYYSFNLEYGIFDIHLTCNVYLSVVGCVYSKCIDDDIIYKHLQWYLYKLVRTIEVPLRGRCYIRTLSLLSQTFSQLILQGDMTYVPQYCTCFMGQTSTVVSMAHGMDSPNAHNKTVSYIRLHTMCESPMRQTQDIYQRAISACIKRLKTSSWFSDDEFKSLKDPYTFGIE